MGKTVEDKLTEEVLRLLEPVARRAVYPETTYRVLDNRGVSIIKDVPKGHEKFGMPPLEPRHRLSTRLSMMVALKQFENKLMKEVLADTESIADARAHGQEVPLGE